MSETHIQTLYFGETRITLMTIAHLRWNFVSEMRPPSAEQARRYAHLLRQPVVIPVHCLHIQASGISLLVDACHPEVGKGTRYEITGLAAHPNLLEQLASVDVLPEDITHVIITHPHFDHIAGLTMREANRSIPCFPHACHYLSRADWESLDVQQSLTLPDSLVSQTLGILQQSRLLELVENAYDLGHGMTILPMPGETPGHQILRVRTTSQALYYIGDLYHHQVEIEAPDWMSSWCDPSTTLRSRQQFSQMALLEKSLLVAAHVPGIGSLQALSGGRVRHVQICL